MVYTPTFRLQPPRPLCRHPPLPSLLLYPPLLVSSTWLGVCYDTQPWIYGVEILAFTPSSATPQLTPSPPPPLGGEDHTSSVPNSTPSLPPASLVHRVPRLYRPTAHKAPRTSAWSSDMTINPGKYFQI